MSARRILVELTEPQIEALIVAAGHWEDHHEPGETGLDPGEARRRPVVARARRALLAALPGGWLPFTPEHPSNRTDH